MSSPCQPAATIDNCPDPSAIACSGSEAELVHGMLAGSDRAWLEFSKRYGRLIHRCITRVTGRFPHMVSAEDIREIYATLVLQLVAHDMRKLRSFDPARGNRLSTWVGMLAINAAYDHLRSLRREPRRAMEVEMDWQWTEHTDPFSEVERKQRARILLSLLESFSAKDQQFVSLYFDQGLDAEEVAARMQISVKTVYSKKHKIKSKLERMLQLEQLAA